MADDLRKIHGTPGAAGRDKAGPAPGDAGKSANPSAPGAPGPDVLAGLDAFSRKIDEEQKAHERAEAERRRRGEEEARRKAEAERARQAQAEAQRKAEAENQSGERRFSALEMLRKQAASRPQVEDTAARRAAAKAVINKNLLASLHFLAEFAKEINAMLPNTETGYGFIYLQKGPQMVLSNAFADYRVRKDDGDEVCDHVFLLYHARYAQPAAVDVAGPDIEHCRRYLSLARVPFEFSAIRKNDFGQPVSGTFTLSDAIPCEMYIRADYDAPAVLIEVLNVGRLGAGRCRLAPEAFNERFADEIAKHALGSENEFARLVTR
jgi:hypothetical protein